MRRGPVAALIAALALALAACGDDDVAEQESVAAAGPGEGGTLAFALAGEPRRLDPLLARDPQSRLVSRQIHEPLVGTVTGPFGDTRRLPGLAQAYSPSGDRSIWRFELRERVRFQDGTPFNASAVLANADRWQATPEGRSALPNVVAVDAPRPDLVRFILDGPDPAFPERLSVPELGIVSPAALPPLSPPDAAITRNQRTGTGPFELRLLEASRALIVRYVDWWGARFQLGPGLDQIEFPVVPEQSERFELLSMGQVLAVERLDEQTVLLLEAQPLLTYEGSDPGPYIGLERSVRGLRFSRGVPLLSGVWLTSVGAAG